MTAPQSVEVAATKKVGSAKKISSSSARRGGSKSLAPGAGETTGLSDERLTKMLRRMILIREFEDATAALFREGRIRGVTHTSQGQEAVAVGASEALRANDYVVGHHRSHGHVIAKGADVRLCMAELLGKATGYCKGRGGSIHIADINGKIIGANGIVGGGIPIAVGVGLSCKLLKYDSVCLCYFGDGALGQGVLHEASNLAAIWQLPVVFLIENNQYAMSGEVDKMVAVNDRGLLCRSDAFGIPGIICDGMDVLEVYQAAKWAVNRAREEFAPSYVFCNTYRFMGHHVADPQTYRDKAEVEEWKLRDPIEAFSRRLVAEDVCPDDEIERIRLESRAEIAAAIEFAESSPDPDPDKLMEDVFG